MQPGSHSRREPCPGGSALPSFHDLHHQDGTYKLSRAVIAQSGDTFKGVYSDATRPQIHANGAQMAFNVGGTKGVTISGLSISGTRGGEWCEPACGGAIKKDGRNLHVLNVRLHHNLNQVSVTLAPDLS